MSGYKGNLFARDDTFFGVCEGLGEDLHIPANLLRVGFAVLLLASFWLAIKIYLGLGLLVLVTRIAFPAAPWRRGPQALPKQPAAAQPADEAEELPLFAKAA